jgi:hypothetical protein
MKSVKDQIDEGKITTFFSGVYSNKIRILNAKCKLKNKILLSHPLDFKDDIKYLYNFIFQSILFHYKIPIDKLKT